MGPVSLLFICCLLYQVYDINAFRNVAYNKSTDQSSSPQVGGDSPHAVDNNTDSDFIQGSCTHTGERNIEWWCVDLQHVYIINNIKLYNRDTLQGRLRGFTTKLSNTGQCNGAGFNSASPCYKDNSQQDHSVYNITQCSQPSSTSLSGRFVFIQNRPYQTLTLCEVRIFKGGCPNDTFGEDCDKQCNINCKDRLCNSTTGTCNTCKPGFYGTNCERTCTVDNCIGNCNINTGKCTNCNLGFYGTNCQQKCNNGCTNNNCNKGNGTCTCKSGFTGDKCENCQQGKYGDAGCGSPCVVTNCIGSCNKTTGHCNSCNNGWYGTNCERSCSEGCLDNNCSKSEGTCPSCMTGWFDERCNSSCVMTNCKGNCKKTTGMCSTCHDGFYGTNCQQDCSIGCLNHTCSKSNGTCPVCTSGWFDERCNASCVVTNCIGNCNKTTGQCNTCDQGWFGENCGQKCNDGCLNNICTKSDGSCDQCNNGWFGISCGSRCSSNCTAGCDKSNGTCIDCKPDTVGPYCNSTCGSGCQPITGNITCNRDGRCTSCVMGRYGDSCNKNCNYACNGGCDRYNGTCINGCIKGKSGEYCDKNCNDNCIHCKQDNINSCTKCKDGRWGTSCHEICSFNCKPPDDSVISLCDRMTGSCSNGCQTGKTRSDCFKDKSEQSKSEGISPVVGGIIGALFGITVTSMICITGFCYYIKRKPPRQPAREPPGYRYNNRPDTCVSPVLTRQNTYDTLEQASNDHGDVADPYYKTLEQVPVYVNLGRE